MAEVPIGVVLLNWNGTRDTIAALDSLWHAEPRPRRVIVVDNGSAADSIDAIQQWIATHSPAWGELLALGTNAGFPGGNNVGLRLLDDDQSIESFLLLNNDATVAPDFFSKLIAGVDARPDGSLFTSTIYEADRTTLWYAGGIERRARALVLHATERPAGTGPVVTEFISGCVMLIPRRTYNALGGLAEVYFPLYWEDVEYSFRGRESVGPLIYIPEAVAYHRVGATVGKAETSPRVAFIQNHHRAMFVRRNFRGTDRAMALGYLLVTKPARFVRDALRGDVSGGAAILAGTMRGIFASNPDRGLDPDVLARR